MTDQSIDLQPIKTKLQGEGPFLILLPPNASVDQFAAGLGLYLSLKTDQKDVLIAATELDSNKLGRLLGSDEIRESIGNRNLVISFNNYNPNSIEKVSASDTSNSSVFELIIQPKTGHKSPDPRQIEYIYRGAAAQLIFTVGVAKLEDLGQIYESERKLFNDTTIVSFNRRQEATYPAIHISDNSASSYSEMMTSFIESVELSINQDIATNLFVGLEVATNRFQHPLVGANAFMMAGKLLQLGAKRQPMGFGGNAGFTPANRPPFFPMGSEQLQSNSPFSQALQRHQQMVTETPQETVQATQTQDNQSETQNPPKDWLEPKIFKGSSQV